MYIAATYNVHAFGRKRLFRIVIRGPVPMESESVNFSNEKIVQCKRVCSRLDFISHFCDAMHTAVVLAVTSSRRIKLCVPADLIIMLFRTRHANSCSL